jgi:hypothetical protein
MKHKIVVAAILFLYSGMPALAGGLQQLYGGGQYTGPMMFQGYNPPIYGGTTPYVSPGTSYSPNYQFNSPSNMIRMTNPYGATYGGYATPYSYGSPYASPYGMYGAPMLIGGNNFGISIGGQNMNYWRSPSGFYYPWLNNPVSSGYTSNTILTVQGNATQPAKPPLSTMLSDMISYVDTQHESGKLADGDFTHIKRRALDLQSKLQALSSEQGGVLDPDSELQLRKDTEQLGADLAHRMQP